MVWCYLFILFDFTFLLFDPGNLLIVICGLLHVSGNLMRFILAGNLIGLPAISVPVSRVLFKLILTLFIKHLKWKNNILPAGWLWQARASNRFADHRSPMGRSYITAFGCCMWGTFNWYPKHTWCTILLSIILTLYADAYADLNIQALCFETKKPASYFDVLKGRWFDCRRQYI